MWGLTPEPARQRPDLLAPSVAAGLAAWPEDAGEPQVAPIDPELADTAAFCDAYQVPLAAAANCVVVAGRRGEHIRYAACVVLATTRADVNGVVRRFLEARKASFAPMADATERTGMAYGGITLIGLPAEWPVLVDQRVVDTANVVIGSGVRHSKLIVAGAGLARLPTAVVLPDLARPVDG